MNVPDIRNFMDAFRKLTLFFSYSAKRKQILKDQLQNGDHENLLADTTNEQDGPLVPDRNYRGLPVLSDTHWLMRVDSMDCQLQSCV